MVAGERDPDELATCRDLLVAPRSCTTLQEIASTMCNTKVCTFIVRLAL
jgi:hypothetical protein